LREICPSEKYTPKYNATSGTIAGILLKHFWLERVFFRE
jgi:hypothetical protein